MYEVNIERGGVSYIEGMEGGRKKRLRMSSGID
jgi:hypothetical protein